MQILYSLLRILNKRSETLRVESNQLFLRQKGAVAVRFSEVRFCDFNRGEDQPAPRARRRLHQSPQRTPPDVSSSPMASKSPLSLKRGMVTRGTSPATPVRIRFVFCSPFRRGVCLRCERQVARRQIAHLHSLIKSGPAR